MGQRRPPAKVKIIAALLSADSGLFEKTKNLLEKRLRNQADYESGEMDFIHTDYYRAEMGEGLKRKFLAFKKHVPPDGLYKIKIISNLIEKSLASEGRRRVNIDPGYLDLSKLVLFSTKDYTHRVYLAKGIFAENTLFYKGGTFNPWPWTYPDYRTRDYVDIFNEIRALYKKNIRISGYQGEGYQGIRVIQTPDILVP
jgi:hypothetical protein